LQALTLIEAGLEIDALVTDVRMPNMDGWTLAERARERHPRIPVLYVTGYSDVAARPVLGSQLLCKPVGACVITSKVTAMLAAEHATA
jgi:CheY-like chemotaxis protein